MPNNRSLVSLSVVYSSRTKPSKGDFEVFSTTRLAIPAFTVVPGSVLVNHGGPPLRAALNESVIVLLAAERNPAPVLGNIDARPGDLRISAHEMLRETLAKLLDLSEGLLARQGIHRNSFRVSVGNTCLLSPSK